MDDVLECRLPGALREWLERHERSTGVTTAQFVVSATEEKLAAVESVGYLDARAERGSREAFDAVLSKVPDGEPGEFDRIT